MKIVSVWFAIFLLIFFCTVSLIFAQESTATSQVTGGQVNGALIKTVPVRFLPSSPVYFLITVKETITKILQPSATKKAEFDSVLAGKRLKETYLLMEKNDVSGAQKNLDRYAKRLNMMVGEIQKAKSQNEDIAQEVDAIVEGFVNQEVLLAFILQKNGDYKLSGVAVTDAFSQAVGSLDTIRPGLKDRFKMLGN